jgi:hypothetical protein
VIFFTSVLMSFILWATVAVRYIWPALQARPRADALYPILLLHASRFVGLAFLVPGVVSPDLPLAFARPAAYGDFLTAIIALLAIAALKKPSGIVLVWIFNVVGFADLLFAFYRGNQSVGAEPGLQGAMYFIPTVVVPLLIVTHVLVFRILLQREAGITRRMQRAS